MLDIIFRKDIITLPVEIHNFVKKKSGREVGLNILVEYSMDNLRGLLDLLISKDISLTHFDWTKVVDGNFLIFIIVDLTKSDVSLEKLIELLREKDYVLEISRADEFMDKFIYSRHLFPIYLGDDKVIAVGPPMMEGMVVTSRELLGEEASTNLLYHIGYAIGKSLYEYLKENVGKWDMESGMRFLDAVLSSYGWGRIKGYRVEDNKVILDVEDLWECQIHAEHNKPPDASLFKGELVGFFEQFYGKRVIVQHTMCLASGHAHCRFEIIVP